MHKAACYLRSSKDRSDVSIDAQRRELLALAKARDLVIVREYVDVVESAKDERRAAFQLLARDVKDPARGWDWLLMVDTSRLARNVWSAHAFAHEAKKRGVRILYSKVPETNPITDLIMLSVLPAVDQMHSLMSREKGLAGMAENVRRGWRAGGRAPWGYRLEHVGTAVVRDGAEVTKSRLALDEAQAPRVQAYLRGRAAGIGRQLLRDRLALAPRDSTLIGVEWQALTYAGHTVWNVHNARTGEGYEHGTKRRPRAEWIIQRDTHPALITESEAEAILARLEGKKITRRRTPADYLLTGILTGADGTAFHGDSGRYYRHGKGKKVRMDAVDRGVLWKLQGDLRSDRFIAALTRAAQKEAGRLEVHGDADRLRRRDRELVDNISKVMDLAPRLADPAPALRKIDQLEGERKAIARELAEAEKEAAAAAIYARITESDVRAMLEAMVTQVDRLDRESLKDWLARILERIELDPQTLNCRLHYRITPAMGDRLASPRDYDAIPPLKIKTKAKLVA